jgi:hypothetical protein
MEKEFVTYELALRMKALRFNEPCFGFYSPIHDLMICNTKSVSDIAGECLAPTWQSAFAWFRRKGFDTEIIPYNLSHSEAKLLNRNKEKLYAISINGKDFPDLLEMEFYKTYEEAQQICLEKLIEIVEQKEKEL